MWLKHTSGFFRFIGGFSGDTHHEDGGVQKCNFFSVCMCEFDQHLTLDAVFLVREEKSGP